MVEELSGEGEIYAGDRLVRRTRYRLRISEGRASSGIEGAALTDQRVSAALGSGSASSRSRNRVTPDFSAASANRRLTVRSSSGHFPQHSTISALRPWQRAASLALLSNLYHRWLR